MFGIQLARQGQTMERGTLVQWKKREGDDLRVGEELYEVETEKAIVPIEVTRAGRLLKYLVLPGESVSVGATLALVADPGEVVSEAGIEAALRAARAGGPTAGSTAVQPAKAAQSASADVGSAEGVRAPPRPPGGPRKIVAVPKARALAQELGVDLGLVEGSGDGETILVDDVRAAAGTAALATAAQVRRAPLTAIDRSRIAALERSCRTPQFTQGVLIDATSLERAKSAAEGELSYMDFFLEAIVKAAAEVPEILARIGQDEIVYSPTLDISIATSTNAGLLIPVLKDAAALTLAQRAPAWRGLVEGARAGTLSPQDMSGGIVALSNLGTRGVDYGTPLLPQGHSAIVFVGALAKRPLVIDDALAARPSLHIAVTFDHRVADGLLASRFTRALHEALTSL